MSADNTPTPAAAEPRSAPHWAVVMNHRFRTAASLAMFVLIGLYLQGGGMLAWVLLALQFLVYPHLAYWRSLRSAEPLQAEIQTMLLDSLLVGVWTAALGFPIWIGFPICIASTINVAAFRGMRGVWQALAAIALGMIAGGSLTGWHFTPATPGPVTALGMLLLMGYLLIYGVGAHQRTLKLNNIRVKLRQSELALQKQLDEIQALQRQLSEQVNRDPLTGLYNRRYLDATMEREMRRCQREGWPLSVLLVDLDHFKRVNDRHGHTVGDEVLQALAALLSQETRAGDVVCRYGGEEFLLLLPGAPEAVAAQRAEQCRARVQTLALKAGETNIPLTLSVGVATAPTHADKTAALIQAADRAMYSAKARGRNQVVVFDPADT